MQQFIPFEDDWDALGRLRPEQLIPYQVGLLAAQAPAAAPSVTVGAERDTADAGVLAVSLAA
ncbi:MAG: hypothetical protein ABI128_16725 [Rhodanobacter sp.]